MILKNLNKNFLINFFLISLIFLLDRISKIYVINLNHKLLGSEIFSSNYLNISLIWNEGIAFGLFSFSQTIMYDLLTLFISLVIIVILIMLIKSNDLRKYPLLMIFGGAIGNLYDRVFYKAVPDFIDVHVNNFHWFIFNVADIFISIGVISMILIEIIDNKRKHD
tara:strand:- start:852 stop:1346 length:495 start_codon:yes stop_codon:yes gene_type:complete